MLKCKDCKQSVKSTGEFSRFKCICGRIIVISRICKPKCPVCKSEDLKLVSLVDDFKF